MSEHFDIDEAFNRLSSALESADKRVTVSLYRLHATARPGMEPERLSEIHVRIGCGKLSHGWFRINQSGEAKSSGSYRWHFSDPDVRDCALAIWDELERQGIMPPRFP